MNDLKMKPIEDWVLIEVIPADEKSAGGIVFPDNCQDEANSGMVLAVGPGKRAEKNGVLIPMQVAKGDMVMYGRHSGFEHKPGVRLLRQPEIIAKLVEA